MATRFSDLDRNLTSENKDVKIRYDIEAIENSITNILTVAKGEVPGRPNFGCVLEQFLFEMQDELTFEAIRQAIKEALIEFEPRIKVYAVEFESYITQQVLLIKISYTILDSGKQEVYLKTFEV
jgi:hypothetical protein